MENPVEWTDQFYTSRYRTVYTQNELGIPGLRMFGKHTMNQACAPLAPHFHRDAFEFTFVTEGAITFTVDGQDYELSGFDIFMTRPNEVHSTNLQPLSAGEIIWFQLDVSGSGPFFFLDEEAKADFLAGLSRLSSHTFRLAHTEDFRSVERAFELASNPCHRHLAAACLLLVLYEIMALPENNPRTVSPDMEKALAYIDAHTASELSLEELAGLCRLSLSQFKQKFKNQVGISPRHYINYRKIQLSKKMLLQNRSVTETAMELGFGSSSYFTVVFRRYNACTPSEYIRREHSLPPEGSA